MNLLEENKKLVMECMAAMNTFEREAYEPFLADEPVYWVGMHRQAGKEAVHSNLAAGRVLYPRPEAATTEVITTLADGNWVAVLMIRRAPTNLISDYENMYAIFYEVIDGKIATMVENLDTALAERSFDFSALSLAMRSNDQISSES